MCSVVQGLADVNEKDIVKPCITVSKRLFIKINSSPAQEQTGYHLPACESGKELGIWCNGNTGTLSGVKI